MIYLRELLRGIPISDVDLTTQHQLEELRRRMNIIRTAWARPMIVTSGLRTYQDQMRINPKSPKSKHLLGQACDIADSSGELKDWLRSNARLLEEAGLWCEHFDHTPGWVHFQSVPPRSGNRFFIP